MPNDIQIDDKTFDELVELSQKDPEEFERWRNEALRRCVEETYPDDKDEQQRALAWINGINMRLDRIKDPIARMAKMEGILMHQFYKLNDALQDFRQVVNDEQETMHTSLRSSIKVIEGGKKDE